MRYSYFLGKERPVSKIVFGGGPLGGVDWGRFNKKQVMSSVCKAYDLGVNFFDTADVYGLGLSEELLSQALGNRKNDVIIATKFGVNWVESPHRGRAKTFYDSSPSRIIDALENSLRRLRIDSIPLYYIHWPDPNTPFSDTAETLTRCQESGKVQNFGVSNFSLSQIKDIGQQLKITTAQVQYSLIKRSVEDDFLSGCKKLGINIITYGPLAQGLLTGKYKEDTKFSNDDCRSRSHHFHGDDFKKHMHILDKMSEISKRYNISMAQVALRWVLENRYVSGTISGIKSSAQIEDNVAALEFDILSDDYEFFFDRS